MKAPGESHRAFSVIVKTNGSFAALLWSSVAPSPHRKSRLFTAVSPLLLLSLPGHLHKLNKLTKLSGNYPPLHWTFKLTRELCGGWGVSAPHLSSRLSLRKCLLSPAAWLQCGDPTFAQQLNISFKSVYQDDNCIHVMWIVWLPPSYTKYVILLQ